jgi:CheY-like chemotaxis protein
LTFDCSHDISEYLLGDPVRLTQIRINLVGNAIKFTRKGTVDVTATLLNEQNDSYSIQFVVKDSGIAIAQDKLNTIFDRFRQAETKTTRHFGDKGLGLSIAKQLIELQGGAIKVANIVDEESTFSFTIPFKQGKDERPMVSNSEKPKFTDSAAFNQLNILLAEDNLVNIKFMTALFTSHGLTFDLANNGEEVLSMLAKKSYDLMLMDVELPKMNGYQATKRIRKDLKNDIPIIAMTARAMARESEKCIKMGMDGYISKPVKAKVLFGKIYRLTSQRPKTTKLQLKKQSKTQLLT